MTEQGQRRASALRNTLELPFDVASDEPSNAVGGLGHGERIERRGSRDSGPVAIMVLKPK